MQVALWGVLVPVAYMLISPCIVRLACPKKKQLRAVPKVSEGCYKWSHYGGGCDKCKTNWSECKCVQNPTKEVGCESCMKFLSDCECNAKDDECKDDDVNDVPVKKSVDEGKEN